MFATTERGRSTIGDGSPEGRDSFIVSHLPKKGKADNEM
jgi:hypothetical protein